MQTINIPEHMIIMQTLKEWAGQTERLTSKAHAMKLLDWTTLMEGRYITERCGLAHLSGTLAMLKKDSRLDLKIHEGDAPYAKVEMNGRLSRVHLTRDHFWMWDFVTRVYLDVYAPLHIMSEKFGSPYLVTSIYFGSRKELTGWDRMVAIWRDK